MYKNILIKLSGEMMSGTQGSGFDEKSVHEIANQLYKIYQQDINFGVVIGAGNIMRGATNSYLNRVKADSAGMLGTAINSIVLQDVLSQKYNIPCIVLGSFGIDGIFPQASPQLIEEYITKKYIIIFAGGTGSPYFSTDTAGVLKALEMKADLMIKATKVDGIYDKDPKKFSDAKKYDQISYQKVLEKRLAVMDLTAISLAMENHLPLCVLDLANLESFFEDKSQGTIVS